MSYRSNSSAETSYSAPQSPVSQTLSPVNSPGLGPPPKDPFTEAGGYYLQSNAQTNALQEHFQHFNMASSCFCYCCCVFPSPPPSLFYFYT